MTITAAPKSIAKPRRLTLATLAACLMLALTGALAPAEPAAASLYIHVYAHQTDFGGQETVAISSSVYYVESIDDATCDMRMYKVGRGAIGEVRVYKEAAISRDRLSCFFDIPLYNLSYGSWTVRVHYHSDQHNLDITGYAPVGVTW